MDARNQHDSWMGIISMDRYQPCLPHPLWSFNNPSNNNVKYCICDMQHLQNAYVIYHICDMQHLQNSYAIYRTCDILHMHFVNVAYHICDTFSRTLALCLGSVYSERTINNAYAFSIYTLEVRFRFLKWNQLCASTQMLW